MGDATTSGLAPRSDFALLGVVSGVFATDDRGVVVALLPPTLIAPPPETRTSRALSGRMLGWDPGRDPGLDGSSPRGFFFSRSAVIAPPRPPPVPALETLALPWLLRLETLAYMSRSQGAWPEGT